MVGRLKKSERIECGNCGYVRKGVCRCPNGVREDSFVRVDETCEKFVKRTTGAKR